jgi:uncharacterized protein (UPF0335 family)
MAEQQSTQPPEHGDNGPDPERLAKYVSEIEEDFAELDGLRSEHMLKCKDVRAHTKAVYKNAKADGINPKALKAAIEQRALERKVLAVAADLDMVEQAQLKTYRIALGDFVDTPLGQAGLSGLGKNGSRVTA